MTLHHDVEYNHSEYVSYQNGSHFIMSLRKVYKENSYTKMGDSIVICTNFNGSLKSSTNSNHHTREISTILTMAGSIVSITVLLCFLITRVLFSELRTLFWKEPKQFVVLTAPLPVDDPFVWEDKNANCV